MLNTIIIVICVIIECIMLLNYCEYTMERRVSAVKCIAVAVSVFLIYCFIVIAGHAVPNILGYTAACFIVMYLGYKITVLNVFIRAIVLTVIMMFSELAAATVINSTISSNMPEQIADSSKFIFMVLAKFLHISLMIVFKHLSAGKRAREQSKEMAFLLIFPVTACLFLSLFNRIKEQLSRELLIMFIAVSVLIIVSNFIVYMVCMQIIEKNAQIDELRESEYKKEYSEQNYRILKEKYEELRVAVHDFNKYYDLIKNCENNEARALEAELKNRNKELLMVEYTNNKALNVLVSQKMKECRLKGIDFKIDIMYIDLSYISESDAVALFGNLLDNATESCERSENKTIYMKIMEINDNLIAIRLENSSDTAPETRNGRFISSKGDKNRHGIGVESIKRTILNYGGKLEWEYDAQKHIFSITIIMGRKKQ